MNLSDDKRRFQRGDTKAGAVLEIGASAQAAPATPVVGCVGFGPAWSVEDSMAASIVRLEQELEEANARIAVLEEQSRILAGERDEARAQLQDIKDAMQGAENPHPNEQHCTCVPLLRAALAEAKGKRDELRAVVEASK